MMLNINIGQTPEILIGDWNMVYQEIHRSIYN